MLVRQTLSPRHAGAMGRQGGVVMLVALIVLVVMTLAGIAMMRSMDTSNLIAGNMAFKQAATHSADAGVETAIAWLEANNSGAFLDASNPPVGYTASTGNNAVYPLGEAFWSQLSASGVCYLPMVGGVCSAAPGVANASGNTVSFMIQRLCGSAGNRNGAACSIVSGSLAATGNNEGPGEDQLTSTSTAVYYRITVRVVGPRNTVSYVQTMVAL